MKWYSVQKDVFYEEIGLFIPLDVREIDLYLRCFHENGRGLTIPDRFEPVVQGKIFRESLWKKCGALGSDCSARSGPVQYLQ